MSKPTRDYGSSDIRGGSLSWHRTARQGAVKEVGAGVVIGDQVFEGEHEARQVAAGRSEHDTSPIYVRGGSLSWHRTARQGAVKEVGAGVVIGDQVFEGEHEARQVAAGADVAKRFEVGFHAGWWHAVSGEDLDLLVGSRKRVFLHGVEFLVKLLAGAYAGELNRDVLIGPKRSEER